MYKNRKVLNKANIISLILVISLSPFFLFNVHSQSPKEEERVDVIIAFKETPGKSHREMVQNAGGEVKHSFQLVPAIAAKIPSRAREALLNNPAVVRVESV